MPTLPSILNQLSSDLVICREQGMNLHRSDMYSCILSVLAHLCMQPLDSSFPIGIGTLAHRSWIVRLTPTDCKTTTTSDGIPTCVILTQSLMIIADVSMVRINRGINLLSKCRFTPPRHCSGRCHKAVACRASDYAVCHSCNGNIADKLVVAFVGGRRERQCTWGQVVSGQTSLRLATLNEPQHMHRLAMGRLGWRQFGMSSKGNIFTHIRTHPTSCRHERALTVPSLIYPFHSKCLRSGHD
jgi:hypothetical protein